MPVCIILQIVNFSSVCVLIPLSYMTFLKPLLILYSVGYKSWTTDSSYGNIFYIFLRFAIAASNLISILRVNFLKVIVKSSKKCYLIKNVDAFESKYRQLILSSKHKRNYFEN